MSFNLRLPSKLTNAGWKVKIRDKERLEPPHVTVMRKTEEWRIDLRSGGFLVPPGGSWNDLPKDLRQEITDNWALLEQEWNAIYGSTNPV